MIMISLNIIKVIVISILKYLCHTFFECSSIGGGLWTNARCRWRVSPLHQLLTPKPLENPKTNNSNSSWSILHFYMSTCLATYPSGHCQHCQIDVAFAMSNIGPPSNNKKRTTSTPLFWDPLGWVYDLVRMSSCSVQLAPCTSLRGRPLACCTLSACSSTLSVLLTLC